MMKFINILLLLSYSLFCQEIEYPYTKKIDQTDNYYGAEVKDPYRWLEDIDSEETKEWIVQQNDLTNQYLEKISFRNKLRERLIEIWNYEKYDMPLNRQDCYYYFKNNGLQEQNVLYKQQKHKGADNTKTFLDPNTFSSDNTIRFKALAFSNDNSYCAYSVSKSGSDWREIHVLNVRTNEKLPDIIKGNKFWGPTWYKRGFFYVAYSPGEEDLKLKTVNKNMKLYYHKLGVEQKKDILIYEDKGNPELSFYPSVTNDEKYLIIHILEGSFSRNKVFIKNLETNSDIFPIVNSLYASYWYIGNLYNKLIFQTNENASNYKLIIVDPKKSNKANWQIIVPEKDCVIESAHHFGKKILVHYLKDANSILTVYDNMGNQIHDISLPGIGTVTQISGRPDDNEVLFNFTSFTIPQTLYKVNIETNKISVFKKPEFQIDLTRFETKQIFFSSKDGTQIPMFITHKKDLKLNNENPVLLYGYGGFGSVSRPEFNAFTLPLLEKGFVYCVAGIRGGNEYGEKWHKNGMLENKQNVFDDFTYGAKYLIENGYTNNRKIAIYGRSNGGLLTAACLLQKPELFQAVITEVGVLDMLRFHKFTIGHAWVPEYGSSDYEEQFNFLYKYSPVHNVIKGRDYPATLIITSDHDDRVFPAHSFKFAATMQENASKKNPVLLHLLKNEGHGAGNTSGLVNKYADMWAFLMYNLGLDFNNN